MASERQLTRSQVEAIRTIGCNLLVSAAAGTGKTHVLAERCGYLVCDAKPPCDVDRLLVVTFTEAAAAEMRTRIGQVIRRRIEATPTDARLHRQLGLLEAATITTIHAFCLQLVRRWFAKIGLDPNIEIMDPDEAVLVRHEVIETLFGALYAAGGRDKLAEGFRRLVDTYGMGRDERIAAMVLRLHAFVQSLPNPAAWLDRAGKHVRLGPDRESIPPEIEELRRTLLLDRIEVLGNAAKLEAEMVRSLYPAAGPIADQLDELTENLRGWYRDLRGAKDPQSLDRIIDAVAAFKFERLPPTRGLDEQAKAELAAARDLRATVTRRLDSELQKRAAVFKSREILDGLGRIGPHVATLVELTKAFDRQYAELKQSEGRVDFDDLERHAFTLLSADQDGTSPSEVAIQVQAEFEHVLVDEFQDVNPIQDAILRLAARQGTPAVPHNLFAVGDVKQSIYRFRLAEPEIFVRRVREYAETASSPQGHATGRGRVVWLQENFRSRPEVLDAVNAVFERLMLPKLAGLAYDEHARLKPGATYPAPPEDSFGRPAAELHLIEKNVNETPPDRTGFSDEPPESIVDDESGTAEDSPLEYEAAEREAMLAGQRILELTGRAEGHRPMTVFEKNDDPAGPPLRPRPIRFRDIVILLRATRNKANHFERVLREMDIPVYAALSTGYFSSTEVRDALSLLQLIDNSRQDIPLAAVLRSPLLGERMNESQLVEIRLHAPALPFHAAARKYAESGPDGKIAERLKGLYAQLDKWRNQLRRQPLSDVLWGILVETGYLAYVGGLRNGLQRRANLIRLHDRARQFGTFARQGLHRFLRFIEELERRELDPGTAAAVSEADDVVRIMSVHRSKGLEFPVVILADLGKQFNLADIRQTMLFDRTRFIGLPVVDRALGVTYPTLTSLAVADEISRQMRAEEMRILYVAMTRAREHLILIGTTPLDDLGRRWQRGLAGPGRVPLIDLVGARSTLDWLVPAAASMSQELVLWSDDPRPPSDATVLFTVHQHDADAMAAWPSLDRGADLTAAALRPFAELAPAPAGDDRRREVDPQVNDVIARVTKPYPHASLGSIPAVVAASELKRRFAQDQEEGEGRATVGVPAPSLRLPRFAVEIPTGGRSLTPAERGTLMHLVMQHVDLNGPCDLHGMVQQVDGMVARGLLSQEERRSIAFEPLVWFFTTELGRRLLAAPRRVHREVPFVLGVPPGRVAPGIDHKQAEQDVVLLRGTIDCLLTDNKDAEIIDFKTDAITREDLGDRVNIYRPQIDIYAEAVRRIWGCSSTRRWLVFLGLLETVEVT
jgi:ATP-dependent helicase/nuclease subunit A